MKILVLSCWKEYLLYGTDRVADIKECEVTLGLDE